jgi:large subunit ribosomal protein L9
VGAKVAKSQVVLDRPIKAIGVHEVKIALHPEVAVIVKVNVARSPEEADLQAQASTSFSRCSRRKRRRLPPRTLLPAAEEGR